MELPFLKNKKNQGGGGPSVEVERQPDSSSSGKFLEMAYDELHDAYHRGDSASFLNGLRAFVQMLKEQN